MMRSLIAVAAFSTFFSTHSFSEDNTFVPTTPSISISADENGEISTTPTFSGSSVAGVDTSAPTAVYGLQASEWLVYEDTDPTVKLLGGFESHTNDLVFSLTTYEERDFPYAVIIDGTQVDRIRIYGAPKIELLSAAGDILAEVSMVPDFTDYVTHQPSHQAIVLSQEFSDAVVYNWMMQSSSVSPNSWNSTFQLIVRYDGKLGIRSSINNLDDTFFSIQSTYQGIGCRMRIDGTLYFAFGNPSQWKAELTNAMQDEFTLVCTPGTDAVDFSYFESAEPPSISIPNFVIRTSSSSTELVVTEAQALQPNTNYIAHARYSVTSDSKTGINKSFWSEPLSFSTVQEQALNTEYHIVISEANNRPFIAGEQKQVFFEVRNVGNQTGNPTFFFQLPFDIFSSSAGDITLTNPDGPFCNIQVSNNSTLFSCQVSNLEPSESKIIEAYLTFSLDQGLFEYAVCETGQCNNPDYIGGTFTVQETATAPESGNDSSGGGGNGGGAMTLLLLAAPFLRRRRVD